MVNKLSLSAVSLLIAFAWSPAFSQAFGPGAVARDNSVAVGQDAFAGGIGSIAVGPGSVASFQQDTAIGFNAIASGAGTSIGSGAVTKGTLAVAVGNSASADGNGVSVGVLSESDRRGIAIGSGSKAMVFQSAAFGVNSVGDAENSVALGSFSSTEGQKRVISIGTSGTGPNDGTRRITNMSAGIAATDGATVGQVSVVKAAAAAAQADATTALTGGANDSVARRRADAAFAAVQAGGVDNLARDRITELDGRAMSGIAASLAIAGASPAIVPEVGESVAGVGVGSYGGRNAVAVSVTSAFNSDAGKTFYSRVSLGVAGSRPALSAGVSFRF